MHFMSCQLTLVATPKGLSYLPHIRTQGSHAFAVGKHTFDAWLLTMYVADQASCMQTQVDAIHLLDVWTPVIPMANAAHCMQKHCWICSSNKGISHSSTSVLAVVT